MFLKIVITLAILTVAALTMMGPYSIQINAQLASVTPEIVYAGGGNSTSVLLDFVPKQIGIKTGESITWDNPTPVSEPHSVTFVKDDKLFPDFVSPFMVINSTEFLTPQQGSNAEPIIIPSQSSDSKTIMAINARAFNPVVIDSKGNVTHLIPNSNYIMDGTEKYVNSGWLWPNQLAPPGGPAINNFTITFEKVGTYNYICNVHPWMTGIVTVN